MNLGIGIGLGFLFCGGGGVGGIPADAILTETGEAILTESGLPLLIDPATAQTVYGSALAHLWFEDYSAYSVGAWGDDAGDRDMTQEDGIPEGLPIAGTTLAGRRSLTFRVPRVGVPNGDTMATPGVSGSVVAPNAAFPVGTKSAQLFGAFYMPESAVNGGDGTYFWVGGYCFSIEFYAPPPARPGVACFVAGTRVKDLTLPVLTAGWHYFVLDMRGDADAATNPANLYVDGVLIKAFAGPLDSPLATAFANPAKYDEYDMGSYGFGTAGAFAFSHVGVAYSATDFALTKAAEIGAVLAAVAGV